MVYIGLFFSLASLRVIDLYITYLITPDLTLEWNPLVSGLAFGWFELVATQILLILIALWGYQRFSNRIRCPVDVPNLGILRFVFYYFNGVEPRTGNWLKCFFKIPNQYYLKTNSAFIGFVVITSFFLVSLFAITHNFLILEEIDGYLEFVILHNTTYMLSVFSFLVILSANIFFLLEYREYQRNTISL